MENKIGLVTVQQCPGCHAPGRAIQGGYYCDQCGRPYAMTETPQERARRIQRWLYGPALGSLWDHVDLDHERSKSIGYDTHVFFPLMDGWYVQVSRTTPYSDRYPAEPDGIPARAPSDGWRFVGVTRD